MTRYYCPKCDRVVIETKDYVVAKRKCQICSSFLIHKSYGRPHIEEKERKKFGGDLWEIRKNDKDFLFGSRHAHNLKNGLKLNLDTGELYNPKIRKITGKMNEKDLENFKSKFKILKSI